MLGTRTKQVFSYGRRNRRVINDDRHDIFEDIKKTSVPSGPRVLDHLAHAVHDTPPPRRGNRTNKNPEFMPSPSSTVSPPPIPSRNRPKKRHENDQAHSSLKCRHSPASSRRPLNSHSVNISGRSPLNGPKKKARLSGSSGALLPPSPAVDVDIIVLDETGRRVSQERRQVNKRTALHPGLSTHRHSSVTDVVVVSDNDDDDPSPQFKRRAKRWPKVMNSSDEEDADQIPVHHVSHLNSPKPNTNREDPSETSEVTDHLKPQTPRPWISPAKLAKTQFWVEIPSLRPPALSRGQPQGLAHNDSPYQPTHGKYRQLTPIRHKGLAFSRLPPSPSTTDLDLSLDLADLVLSSTPVEIHAVHDQPHHLIPLLDECGQDAPVEFSAFIEAFPVHPIVQSSCSGRASFQKIGEASYSEVFGIGDVVLKIIPIRDEEYPDKTDAETPAPSDAKDILQEIVVTRALGEICNGFVNLLKTYVVRGRYPSLLLDLWDEYNRTKGSESVRPDMLAVSQVYAIIVLPNGGPDLEAYSFSQPAKTGWRQACSLFWQITRALAMAENLVSFEHRDLHWGQILVKNVPSNASSRRNASTTDVWLPMDHLVHGVKATVIDLGLARMDAQADDGSTEVRWTPFDEEIFEGEGDYQFDIYRLMRKHNGSRWADFRPLSNVMWLHYLLTKLLKSKNLRTPRKANASTSLGFTERQCYDCLLTMENLLAQCVQEVQAPKPVATKTGRRKMTSPMKTAVVSSSVPKCAGDALKFGETMGWV